MPPKKKYERILNFFNYKRPLVPPSNPKSIAVIRFDNIGDFVLTGPFLKELRKLNPKASITLVVPKQMENLVSKCPYVDQVLSIDASLPEKGTHTRRLFRYWLFAIRFLRKLKLDTIYLPRWDIDNMDCAVLAFFSKAKSIIGFSEHVNNKKSIEYAGLDLLLTKAVNLELSFFHEAPRQLSLLYPYEEITKKQLASEAWTTKEDQEKAANLLNPLIKNKDPLIIAISLTASEIGRVWPLEYFVQLSHLILKNPRCHIVLIGGADSLKWGKIFIHNIKERCLNLINKTSLRETQEVLRSCDLFIGGDSGPLHLASSVDIPLIEISYYPKNANNPLHPNNPIRFAPLSSKATILQPDNFRYPCEKECSFDFSHCINQIKVKDVFSAIPEEFKAKSPRPISLASS
jgi:ADP-heptose:LPS heptosyltransferase